MTIINTRKNRAWPGSATLIMHVSCMTHYRTPGKVPRGRVIYLNGCVTFITINVCQNQERVRHKIYYRTVILFIAVSQIK